MRSFGLTPDEVLARSGGVLRASVSSAAGAMVQGALSFAVVSVVAYSIWAFKLIPGEAAMYAAIAAIYIGVTGLALSRLVLGAGAAPRFSLLFATVFAVYAIIWCAFWFGLHGKHQADLWGAAVGLAAMTALVQRAFGLPGSFLPLYAVLFTFHTLGYSLGGELYATVRGAPGRLLWGAAHGLGFGAGLGYVLYHVQVPIRSRAGLK